MDPFVFRIEKHESAPFSAQKHGYSRFVLIRLIILIDLIRNVLGEYCLNLPVTLLTQKRKASNAACPEKAQTKGVRLCYMQEPDSGEKINAGEMKELTGGDVITARKLYQDVFSFKPQFELWLMCNEKPIIDDKTNGAWRRVQVYPFESRLLLVGSNP